MKFTKTILVLLFSCSLCFAQEFIGPKKDLDQILENAKKFSQYIVDANYERIVNSYTADAKIFPNNMEILTGKEAILQYWTLPEGIRTSYHKFMPEEIKVLGDEAYDYGYYEGTTQRADGSQSSWKGKYVVIWRKANGEWKMYLDIWNGVR
jgi:ketosteroid isomerase-like protein